MTKDKNFGIVKSVHTQLIKLWVSDQLMRNLHAWHEVQWEKKINMDENIG